MLNIIEIIREKKNKQEDISVSDSEYEKNNAALEDNPQQDSPEDEFYSIIDFEE